MKLARPDVFHPRIVLAGCRGRVAGDEDDAGLVAALRQRGLHARWVACGDPEAGRADLVILRATGDSAFTAGRRDEFLSWITSVRNLLNPPGVVTWNLDARYLRDLESAGVPTVPDGPPGRPADRTALIFLGGEPSHAFAGARPVEPDFEVWDLGYAALASAAEYGGKNVGGPGELLYARVDVQDDRVAGVDLVAPSLGWGLLDAETRDGAQRRFALGVESACERLGLGPFSRPSSHGGP